MDLLSPSVLIVALYTLPVLLVGAGLQAVRLFDAVSRRPDPHLGRKLILHGLASLAVGLLLVAATGTVAHTAEVVVPKPGGAAAEWWNDTQRVMAGLAVSGLVYLLLCEAALRLGTNDRRRPRVRRAAAGLRFATAAGLCMALGTVGSCLAFSADGPDPTTIATVLGLTGVWLPAAGFHYWLMAGRDAMAGEPAA